MLENLFSSPWLIRSHGNGASELGVIFFKPMKQLNTWGLIWFNVTHAQELDFLLGKVKKNLAFGLIAVCLLLDAQCFWNMFSRLCLSIILCQCLCMSRGTRDWRQFAGPFSRARTLEDKIRKLYDGGQSWRWVGVWGFLTAKSGAENEMVRKSDGGKPTLD